LGMWQQRVQVPNPLALPCLAAHPRRLLGVGLNVEVGVLDSGLWPVTSGR